MKLKTRKGGKRLKPIDNSTLLKFKQQLSNFKNGEESKEELDVSKILDTSHELNLDDLTQEDKFYLI